MQDVAIDVGANHEHGIGFSNITSTGRVSVSGCSWNGTKGINDVYPYAVNGSSSKIDFSNCTSTNGGSSWIVQDTASDITFTDCTATDGAGFKVVNTANNVIYRNCTALRSSTQGFLVDNGANNVTYYDCLAKDGSTDGFGAGSGSGGPVHDINWWRCRSSHNGSGLDNASGDGFTSHLTNYSINCYYCISDHNTASGWAMWGTGSGVIYNSVALYNSVGNTFADRGNYAFSNVGAPGNYIVKNSIGVGGYPREIFANALSLGSFDYNLFFPTDSNHFYSQYQIFVDDLSWTTYHTTNGYESHSINTDPLFTNSTGLYSNSSDFHLQSTSSAIDSGTATVLTSTTTDYLGHPLYGLPDIGAYEYQPPFTLGTSLVDPTGNIRIYGDRMYRYTTATSSTMHANFSVVPAETWTYAASTTRPEWLNISNMTWNTTDSYTKQWTASSTLSDSPSGVHATSTIYTIGDLLPNAVYTFKLDGVASTTAIIDNTQCTNGVCTADGSGIITFTYQGGYSTHIFALEDITAPVSSASPSGSTYSNIQSVSLSCSDSSSGCDKIYYTTNGSTPTTSSSIYSSPITINSGYTSLKFFATDLAGNSEAVHTENYTIITGSVSIFSAPAANTVAPTAIVDNPLNPPLQGGQNANPAGNINNPPNPLYQGGKNPSTTATVEMMLSEALQLVQGRPTEILANFITNGTPSTLILGSGERSGVVNSFTSAFGRTPQTEADWSDVIKIANGRWPSQRNEETEINAAAAFKKIYKRNADRNNPHDDAAVTIISYGLRPANRNLNSERAAIKSFMAVYGHIPKSAMAWDIVRAIAYSGAKR